MFKKTMLSLSLMLSLACFAGTNPWVVKTQEDVDALTKYKDIGEKVLAIRQDADFQNVKNLDDAKALVKKYGVEKNNVYMYIANIREINGNAVYFIDDPDCPTEIVCLYLNVINSHDKDKAFAFVKSNITSFKSIKLLKPMINLYINNLSKINENEAKTTLKKVYLNVYPKIAENEDYKPLAVQVKLALDALAE